ncbi:MAG: winged helix-turn-helix transcriptional regulator [Nanoarchaeota archaeon]|nr:winged helix-turn-helix transcriptional regulator [Nanoarchaeota archaeon]
MRTNKIITKNQRKVLSMLLDNSRSTDSEIAAKIRITPQAVRKIRKKLEENYIREYRTVIDYSSFGIDVFAIVHARVKNREILKNANIIGAFEINEANITHILILGFKTIEELDDFKINIVEHADIHRINVVSKKGFLKNTPVTLIKKLISEMG